MNEPTEAPRAHSPLPRPSDRTFVAAISAESRKADSLSPEEERNRERAGENLGHIFSLRDSSAFDWYLREGLLAKIAEAERALKLGSPENESLVVAQARWKALAELHDWLIGMEMAHRRTLDKNDPELSRLTAKLLLS